MKINPIIRTLIYANICICSIIYEMGKHANAKRFYHAEWEKEKDFKGWLSESPSDKNSAYCKLCESTLRPHKSDIMKHKNSQKHRTREQAVRYQKTILDFSVDVSNPAKKRDIILAMYIASHSAIRTIDHLGEIINKNFSPSNELNFLSLHRTKCAAIISNVIAPSLVNQLKEEIGTSYFSIIVDESTDVGTVKVMGYCIRYYNTKYEKILSDFLGLQVVVRTTAEELLQKFEEFMSTFGLNLNNMIALGTDGAANLCGCTHSLFILLKKKYPRLVLFKCICHSLDKCSQYACTELPAHLEFILRETRSWFSHSYLWQRTYTEIYESLKGVEPPKLTTLANTRWLSFYKASHQTVQQWEALKKLFQEVVVEASQDVLKKCYTARQLNSMYNDESNHLYFLFINSALEDVYKVNLAFQSNKIDIVHAYHDLYLLVTTTARRLFKPSFLRVHDKLDPVAKRNAELECVKLAVEKSKVEFGNSLLNLEDVDYGYKFQEHHSKLMKAGTAKDLPMKDIKHYCRNFLLKLMEQFIQRLPSNFQDVDKVWYFSPKICTDRETAPSRMLPWNLMPSHLNQESLQNQWSKLQSMGNNINIKEEDPLKFWLEVGKITNALGERIFEELTQFAIVALSLPISNAIIERVFSVMSVVKSKLRNKLGLHMLNSILHIRIYNAVRHLCCHQFEPTASMYLLHNNNMYNFRKKNNEVSDDISDDIRCDDPDDLLNEILDFQIMNANESHCITFYEPDD